VYETLLFLHILTAFAIVATVVVFSAFALGLAADSRVLAVGNVLWAVGGLGVLVFGVWLALYVEGYEIWDGWIVAAIVLWIFLGAVGNMTGKVYYAARDRARALAAEGDAPSPELNAMLRSSRGLALHAASVVFTLAILVDMIYKPGA
jgi:uncharacterized membrane protein